MNVRRTVAGVAGIILLGATLVACSTGKAEPDQVGLHYSAGPLSATKFSDCVPQSSRKVNGPSDKYFYYPAGQRTFKFNADKDAEKTGFDVVSKDNQTLTVTGLLTFNLDTTCDNKGDSILQKFHENIGLKTQAYMDSDDTTSKGWDAMLLTYMGQPLQQMLSTAAQQYDWLALYNDPATRQAFEQQVNGQLASSIQATTGGEAYFQHFSLTLQKPEIPTPLADALQAVQVQLTQNKAIAQQNQNIQDALAGIKALTDVLGPYGYILYEVLQNCMTGKQTAGCPTYLPIPAGGNVNIPGPTAK